jgi:ACT domain-containing protein
MVAARKKKSVAPAKRGAAAGVTPSLASVKEIISTIGAHRPSGSSPDAPRAVVWVIGTDRPGILAAVTTLLFDNGVNILDVSQTVLRGMFAMILIGDISALTVSFAALKLELESLGKDLNMVVSAQRAAVFEEMHRL